MAITFIHTADWQLGKPFARVQDPNKRALLQQERINVLERIAEIARREHAAFVVVAGDLFDSPTPTQPVVSAACGAIGAMGIPVYAIPGNHDHGGPGSLWEQPFFQREWRQLAPNLSVLLNPTPLETASAVLFPCPLLRRRESADLTGWLRSIDGSTDRFSGTPRIVIAHGMVHGFAAASDDDESGGEVSNLIDVARIPAAAFDYVALGDWHGTKQVGTKAWYSGTPEIDRFPKGESNDPGSVLVVTAERQADPQVRQLRTARFGWHAVEFTFAGDESLTQLAARVQDRIGTRAGSDLLLLELSGSLGIEATNSLAELLESWNARLLRVKLYDRTVIAPSADEIEALTRQAADPLIARVAAELVAKAEGNSEEAAVARQALRELHSLCTHS